MWQLKIGKIKASKKIESNIQANDLFRNDNFVRFNFYFSITNARVSNGYEKAYITSSFSRRSFISFDVMTAYVTVSQLAGSY